MVECIVPTIDTTTNSLRVIKFGLKNLSACTLNKIKLARAFVNLEAKMEQLDAQGLADEYDKNGNVVCICVKYYLP